MTDISGATPAHFARVTRLGGSGRITQQTELPEYNPFAGRRHFSPQMSLENSEVPRRMLKSVDIHFTPSEPKMNHQRAHLPPPEVEKVVPPAQKKHYTPDEIPKPIECVFEETIGRKHKVEGISKNMRCPDEVNLELKMGRHSRVQDVRNGVGEANPGDKPFASPDYCGRYYFDEGGVGPRCADFAKSIRARPIERKVNEAMQAATQRLLSRVSTSEKIRRQELKEEIEGVHALPQDWPPQKRIDQEAT